jgi:hypothetical protein
MSFISLQTAIDMTTFYRENKEKVIDSEYATNGVLSICDTFDKSEIEALVSKTNCSKIRLYYGMNEEFQVRPILVAVDSNDADILPSIAAATNEDIVNDSIKCPPICPPGSALNE